MNKDDKYNEMEGMGTNFDALLQETSGDDNKVSIPTEHSDFTVEAVFTNLRRCVTLSHKCGECPFKGVDDCKMILLKQALLTMVCMMAQIQVMTEKLDHDDTEED